MGIDTSELDIDECIEINVLVHFISEGIDGYMPVNYKTSANYVRAYFSRTDGFYIEVGATDSSYRGRPVILIGEYTKTTDEATIAIATVNELNAAYEEGVQAA